MTGPSESASSSPPSALETELALFAEAACELCTAHGDEARLLEVVERRADQARAWRPELSRKLSACSALLLATARALTPHRMLIGKAALQIEEAQRSLERRFREQLELASDAMVLTHESGRIVQVNRQAEVLFGYDRSELVGERIARVIPGCRALTQLGSGEQSLPGSGALDALLGQRKDGTAFPIELSVSPILTGAGLLVATAVRDRSERAKEAEYTQSALKLANRELEAFGYAVSHDLREPLRGMSGFARILLDTYGDKLNAEGQDCLHEIVLNARKSADLIDALSSLSRVSRSELCIERVDLSALAADTVSALSARDPARAVSFVAPQAAPAELDPRLARILIDNLISNAWKYTGKTDHARIELGVRADSGKRIYYVRDNGAGFDPRFMEKLFVPFQRLHPAPEFPGTGIGLATAQRIVHRHGGQIWAQGSVNKGATFSFTIAGTVTGIPS